MVGKVWLFVVVAVTLAAAVSSKQVSGTGMCYLSYEQTFKQSKKTKCHLMHVKNIYTKYLQNRKKGK